MSATKDRAVLRGFRRPFVWVAIWAAMVGGVVAGSLVPPSTLPTPMFDGVDKLQHLLGYFALSLYAVMLFARQRGQALAAAGLVLLGIGLEVAQAALTASRQADLVDAACNGAGVLLALPLASTRVAGLLQRIDQRLR